MITLTLACTLFVLVPWLNETQGWLLFGLLLVLFLPGYSLVVAFFPRRGNLDGILADRVQFWFEYRCCAANRSCTQIYTQCGIRLVPVLLGVSLFMILLAVVAYIWRAWISEAEWFVVGVWGLGCGGCGRGGSGRVLS